jgi:rare lipoprotein A
MQAESNEAGQGLRLARFSSLNRHIVLIQLQALPVKCRAWRGGAQKLSPGDRLPQELHHAAPLRNRLLARVLAGVCAAAFLSACTTSEPVKVSFKPKAKSKEYFAEKDYGVKASPRVIAAALHLPGVKAKRLPRGGGREQVGKPYKIRGKWYYPREDMAYDKSGTASWYGAAFHGRRTANGEIYDMNQLSAAHPTMPLPSYARVTNLSNGNTLIVRVNDRGPYAHNRLIDMSKRAAEMLDYTGSGTAQVRVQYVGRAPVQGNDDQYLLASYQQGGGAVPQDAMQPDVMVAMAGPTLDLPGVNTQPLLEGEMPAVQGAEPQDPFALMESVDVPTVGPFVPDKPISNPAVPTPVAANADGGSGLLGYADQRIDAAYAAAEPFKAMDLSETRIKAAWNRGKTKSDSEYILLGTFSKAAARQLQGALKGFGRLDAEADGQTVTLSLRTDGAVPLDQLLCSPGPQGLQTHSWSATSGRRGAFILLPNLC